MKILFIESDNLKEYNCSNWRCAIPMRALRRAGHDAHMMRIEEWDKSNEKAIKLTQAADIIFVQRNLFNETLGEVFYWRAKGKVVVADVDDSYKDMTEETGSPSYAYWIKGKIKEGDKEYILSPTPQEMLTFGAKLCGSLSSPSELICEDWKKIVRTYWFPNYLDLSLYKRNTNFRHDPGAIHIGWGGSMTHLVSWIASGAAEAVSQLINENPMIKFVHVGDPRCERLFKIPAKNRLCGVWIPQPSFGAKLSSFDIGLIPLSGEYDRRRSWIKTAEYSVMGIPWIGTDMEPTRSVDTGLRVKNTAEDWYKALKLYTENIEAFQDAAAANIEASKERFDIDLHTDELVTLFEKIIKEAK